jgi:O-antigen/teichoic acid export membrane protein
MMARHLVAYLLPNLAQAVASFGTVAILTRLLSDAEYGRFTLVFSAMTLLHYLTLTWVEAAAARFYAEADERGEKADHFASLIRAFAWCAAGFAAVAGLVVWLWPGDEALKLAMAAAFGGVIMRSFIKIALETRRMARQAKRFAAVDTLHTLLGFALGMGCVVGLSMGPEGPFLGLLIAALVVLAIEGPALWLAGRCGTVQTARLSRYFGYGAPLAAGLILTLALANGDRFLIAAYLGEAEVGAYAAGYQVAARILDMVFVWGSSAITPLLVAAYERGGPEEAAATAYDGYAVRLGIGAPAAVGLALLAGPLCEVLIGESLRERAAAIVPWIALASLMAGMCDYFSEAFMLAKKALQRALLMLVPTLISLVLNMILLPRIGLMGAVYATVAAYGFGMVLLALVGRRHVRLPVPPVETARIAFACLVMAGVVQMAPAPGGFLEVLVKATMGAIAYGCVALLLDVAKARGRLQDALARVTRKAA